MRIAVYCGSGPGNDPAYTAGARALGKWIGENGHTLVYGGGDAGIMGAVASAVFETGSPVIGVVPGDVAFIADRPQPYVTELIRAENMSARKQRMLELADAFIALPGGMGTIDEITEVITLTKIGVFNKPSVLFDQDGFYAPLAAMIDRMCDADFLRHEEMSHVLFSSDIDEIAAFLSK